MTSSTARLTVILAATLVTSVAVAAERTYDKRLDAPPGGHLTFDADVGSVSVVGGDAPAVAVHADIEGSQSLLDRLHITTEKTPSGVTISERVDHEGWLGWLGWLNSGPSRVRFTVEVPRDYPVDLRTSGGNLDVRNLNARALGKTSGGGIHVQDIAGAVHVHTSGGDIEAERLNGSAELTTSGGGIEVADSTGDLDLHTSGGSIRLQDDDGRVQGSTSGGSIRAQLRANRGISLATSGGGITLLLPRGTSGLINAATSGGGVRSELPLSTVETADGNHLEGAIGGGGAPISLHTSGGSIHILPFP